MSRARHRFALGAGLCGAIGCASEQPLPEHRLDGITVLVGFDEPICGGTFGWLEERLRWLEHETDLPASEPPILFSWLREDVYDHCPTGACTNGRRIYSPLELISHELVHAHLSRLGTPRSWLAEGMARLLEDVRWDGADPPTTPSLLLETGSADLDYASAARFVGFLRDRFGMPTLLELYAELDGADGQQTREDFLAVLGESFEDIEEAYLASETSRYVGSIDCVFPKLMPESGVWEFPVDTTCADTTTIGPFLGWSEESIPYIRRSATLEVPASGAYTLSIASNDKIFTELVVCEGEVPALSRYTAALTEEILLAPGRYRLTIESDVDAQDTGEVMLIGPGEVHGPDS